MTELVSSTISLHKKATSSHHGRLLNYFYPQTGSSMTAHILSQEASM